MSQRAYAISWRELTLLTLLTLLAAALRFYRLGDWSYMIDELHTWDNTLRFYSRPLSTLFYPNYGQAFWLSTKLSLDTFGENAISLRLFPCILGILTVPLVYIPLRAIFDKRVGLIGVFIIAISPWHIYMSQMARWYTLLVLLIFFALISFYIFIESNKIRYFFLYGLLFYLAFALHLTAGFVPVIAVFYVFLLLMMPKYQNTHIDRKKLLIILGIHLLFAIALLPMLMTFLERWKSLEDVVGQWGSDVILKVLYHVTPSIGAFALAGLVLLLRLHDRRGLFFASYSLLPVVILSLAIAFSINISARYLFFILPGVALAASFLCIYLKDQIHKYNGLLTASIIIAIILPSLQADYLYFTSEYGYRDRLREVVRFIKEKKIETDQFYIPIMFTPQDTKFYYGSISYMEKMSINDEQIVTPSSEGDLDIGRRIWIITLGRTQVSEEERWKWISEKTRLVAEFAANRANQDQTIKVYLYSP